MEWYVGYLYHVKPMLICHLIATMRGSYNTGAAANLNNKLLFSDGLLVITFWSSRNG